jgi:hypothetical protein
VELKYKLYRVGTLEGMEMEYNGEWHLNKSVPIALIFAIFIQTAGAIWWASTINAKVDELDRSISQSNVIQVDDSRDLASENLRQWARINVLEDAVQKITANNNTLEAILTRLEEQVKENNSLLKEYLRGSGSHQ